METTNLNNQSRLSKKREYHKRFASVEAKNALLSDEVLTFTHDSLMNLPPAKFLLKYGKLPEFPTFQQDINIIRKTINLNIAK